MNGFPFTNFHDINLDWILSKLKKAVFTVNGQGPDDNGNINLAGVAGVTSVNTVGPDSTGNVTLTPADVRAMPDSYQAPVASVNGQTGAVSLSAASVGAMPANYQPPVFSVNGQTGAVVLDAADVSALPDNYTAPVSSVNGQTGAVSLDASDVSALPDTTVIPDRTSQLINDSGYITSQQAAAVTSVNGMVGAVVLDADDVGALPDTTVVPTLTSQLVNDSGYITSAQAAPVQSVNSKVGNVVLDASDVGALPTTWPGSWMFVGEETGSTAITLPTGPNWTEVYVRALFGSNTTVCFDDMIPRAALSDTTGKWCLHGSFNTTGDYHSAVISVDTTTAQLISWNYVGASVLSTSKLQVWVR